MKDLLTIQNLIFILGGLGAALKLWLKFRPQDRDELKIAAQGIDVTDTVIDTLLETFPDNSALQSVDDVVDKLQKQFEKAGIEVDKKKLEEKAKRKVQDSDNLELKSDLLIDYKTKF